MSCRTRLESVPLPSPGDTRCTCLRRGVDLWEWTEWTTWPEKNDGFRGATPYDLVDKILWFEMMGILAGAGPRNWTIPQVSCSLSFLMILVWPTKLHTAGHLLPSGNQTLQWHILIYIRMIFPLKPLLSLVIYQPAMFDDTVAGMIPSTAEKLTSSHFRANFRSLRAQNEKDRPGIPQSRVRINGRLPGCPFWNHQAIFSASKTDYLKIDII
jgi:hypothetical protein